MRNIILIVFYIFTFCSCNTKSTIVRPNNSFNPDTVRASIDGQKIWWFYDEHKNLQMNDPTKEFFENWREDTSGYEYRGKFIPFFGAVGEGIHFLNGLRKTDIIKYMGPSDRKNSGEGYMTVTYNMEWGCGNPEYDCCWLSIYFDVKNVVTEVSVGCT